MTQLRRILGNRVEQRALKPLDIQLHELHFRVGGSHGSLVQQHFEILLPFGKFPANVLRIDVHLGGGEYRAAACDSNRTRQRSVSYPRWIDPGRISRDVFGLRQSVVQKTANLLIQIMFFLLRTVVFGSSLVELPP